MIINALRDQYKASGIYFSEAELYDPPPFEAQEKLIFGPIVDLNDAVREALGRALRCSAGVRTPEKQEDLRRRGLRAAIYSPHVLGRCAMDLDVSTKAEVYDLVDLIKEVARNIGIPVRLGYKKYLALGQTFVHTDSAPLIAEAALRDKLITEAAFNAWTKVLIW